MDKDQADREAYADWIRTQEQRAKRLQATADYFEAFKKGLKRLAEAFQNLISDFTREFLKYIGWTQGSSQDPDRADATAEQEGDENHVSIYTGKNSDYHRGDLQHDHSIFQGGVKMNRYIGIFKENSEHAGKHQIIEAETYKDAMDLMNLAHAGKWKVIRTESGMRRLEEALREPYRGEALPDILRPVPEAKDPVKRYFFTFGHGQEHAGKYQIIEAENMEQARGLMNSYYGSKWAMSYTEDRWNTTTKNLEDKGFGDMVEKPLPFVIRKGYTFEEKMITIMNGLTQKAEDEDDEQIQYIYRNLAKDIEKALNTPIEG